MAPPIRPRVAFVVQRAGPEIIGGAESLCLQVAQRMSAYWDTEILTTCALDYMTWDNVYEPGIVQCGSTILRRFAVDHPRDVAQFDAMSAAIVQKGNTASLVEQEHWMNAQGPVSSSLLNYLRNHSHEYTAFFFFGYLYWTTYFGLPLVRNKAFLAPLAHDEWTIHLPMWDDFFHQPAGYVFQTPEEQAFLRSRFPSARLEGPLAGLGIDIPSDISAERFRVKYNLHEPFLLYVGRIDDSKGCGEMFRWFMSREQKQHERYRLVIMGKEVLPVPFHDNIVYLGIVPEGEKFDAMAACDWLIVPSAYESLSISLLEVWATARPALVNARSDVLRGQCERARGGLWFSSWIDCDELMKEVHAQTKMELGLNGCNYVRHQYSWDRIQQSYLAEFATFTRNVRLAAKLPDDSSTSSR